MMLLVRLPDEALSLTGLLGTVTARVNSVCAPMLSRGGARQPRSELRR